MDKFKTALRKLGKLILECTVGSLLLVCLWFLIVELPYCRFKEEYNKIKPDLEAVNEGVLAQLPPPAGIVETDRFSYTGGERLYGAELKVWYLRGDVTVDQIVAHYESILASGGWKKIESRSDSTGGMYFKDIGCLGLQADPRSNRDKYEVFVWHDYLRLDFTPKPPPFWVMFIHELITLPQHGGKRYFECPYDGVKD